ncbi:MAG: hypothetical protein AB7O96_18370 [Pseudobdellovibrionaceae bacterium]
MKNLAMLISILALLLGYQNCSNKKVDDVSAVVAYQGEVFNTYQSEQIVSLEYWQVNPGVLVNGEKIEDHIRATFDHAVRNIDYELFRQALNSDGSFKGSAKVLCTKRLSVQDYNDVVKAIAGSVLIKDKGTGNSGATKSNLAIKDTSNVVRVIGFDTADDDYGDQVVYTPSEMQNWFEKSAANFCSGQ